MAYLLEMVSLDNAISKADEMQQKAMSHTLDLSITEKERDQRCALRDYLYSVHVYLKELKALKEKK